MSWAKRSEKCASFCLIEIVGQIFGVNVVENAPKITLVARLVLVGFNHIIVAH